MREEIDFEPIQVFLLSAGARVFAPKIRAGQEPVLDFFQIDSGTAWIAGPLGIEEPQSDRKLADPTELDLIFVPGVVFGLHGERLGMGKGYYDRFLARNDRALRVSLAFDFQCEENIPQQSWDQPVDWVLTEVREFRGPNWARKMDMLAGQHKSQIRKSSRSSP